MDIHVGFTGTREGMTDIQKYIYTRNFLLIIAKKLPIDRICFHHGLCIGSDDEAHDIAKENNCYIIGHPPLNKRFAVDKIVNEMREPLPYLMRDHKIVDEATIMFGTPNSKQEILKSGTWATIRYARKLHRLLTIIYPDGTAGR